jgi:UPF0755 protein
MGFTFFTKPGRISLWRVVVVVLLGVMFWGVYYTLFSVCVFTPEGEESIDVVIYPGWSLSKVADILKRDGVILDRNGFLLWARVLGLETRIRAGRYAFRGGSRVYQIIDALRYGGETIQKITIPEGLTAMEIAHTVYSDAEEAIPEFLALVRDSALIFIGEPVETGLEGYLFPDTYHFVWDLDPPSVIREMVNNFLHTYNDSLRRRAQELRLSRHAVVTLASIIEREARVPEERRRISAVFHNRLQKGMRLQADPTVRYALREWGRPLLLKDLKVDSPYNTYLYTGVPPGPICNPGLHAIHAALWPLENCDDLYFVARRDGSYRHIFSRTEREHNRARRRVKRAKGRGDSQPY